MLDLNVKILAAFGPEELLAATVGTDVGLLDFMRRPSDMLLAFTPLGLQAEIIGVKSLLLWKGSLVTPFLALWRLLQEGVL